MSPPLLAPVPPHAARGAERGFSLVMLLAAITVMMIVMGAAVPTWRYVMQDDREQELYFRGDQIARAVEEYQRKNGNAFPPSLDVLVKGRFLRKAYKDPMTKDGKWRLVRPGETVMASAPGGAGASPKPGASASPAFGATQPIGGTSIGVIAGVASLSKQDSLRLFNGRTRYDQWVFLAGQPRRLGRNTGPMPGAPGLPGMPGMPGNAPGATNPGAAPAGGTGGRTGASPLG
jgi:type II secretory pathway pseudopilin PulG